MFYGSTWSEEAVLGVLIADQGIFSTVKTTSLDRTSPVQYESQHLNKTAQYWVATPQTVRYKKISINLTEGPQNG